MIPDDPPGSRWADVQGLLEQALALPPEERGAWLRNLPADYEFVREILRRLLEAKARAEGLPWPETTGTGANTLREDPLVGPGELVGPYRILRELGSGGMGAVWLAERADGQLRRKFALKLPRMVWAPDLAARVARERDILVSLEHPHIARLYDAGVDNQGRPFLAIEYVEGQRIDLYCDERRLGVRDRVLLFKQVVDAVKYAHTQLVIHRDLKPANVLVNSRGKATLLDFGIASLLPDASGGDAEQVALTVSRAMTPRFASPEQLQGARLSLTSDVYSLGVMLYDLLASSTPYRTRNPTRSEFERAVIEGDIRVPSESDLTEEIASRRGTTSQRLARQLGGDLDAIVAKAMRLSPQDRYPSVEAMAADLERWLTGHPVLAKPPSRVERWIKFTRRNPVLVGLGAVATVLIGISTVVAVLQSIQARAETRRANATNEFLLEMFAYANPELHGGRDITARELLLEGEKRIGTTLRDQPDVKASVFGAMADVWAQVGDLQKVELLTKQRLAELKNVGSSSEIQQSTIALAYIYVARYELDKAQSILDLLIREGPIREEVVLADYLWLRGWILLQRDKASLALPLFNESYDAAKSAERPSEMVRALYGQLQYYAAVHDTVSALEVFDKSLTILNDLIPVPAELLRRKFELVSVIYALGEYRIGWPHINDLVTRSERIYGAYTSSQAPLRHEWINWCAQMNELKPVIQWIENAPRVINGIKTTAESKRDYVRLAMEARVYALAGRTEDARRRLNLVAETQSENDLARKVLFYLIESEIFIREGMFSYAIESLSNLTELESAGSLNEVDRMYYFWNLGIARLKFGDLNAAKRDLGIAEDIATKNFGRNHPRVNLIFLARLLSEENPSVSKQDRERLENVLTSLGSSLSTSHPLVKTATRVNSEVLRDGGRSEIWDGLRRLDIF